MPWIIPSQPPLVAIPNWCWENVLEKFHKIEDIKHNFQVDTMIPPLQWDEFHLKVWSWLRGKPLQGRMQFAMECDPVQYENKVVPTKGIYLLNLQA
jgi:hypothetical protein